MSQIYRYCRFCYGSFIPKSRTQKFCSEFCQTSFYRFEQLRSERQRAEEMASFQIEQRRASGQKMHVCRGCCAVYFTSGESEFCSAACETLYGRGNLHKGISLHILTETYEKQRAASNRVELRKTMLETTQLQAKNSPQGALNARLEKK